MTKPRPKQTVVLKALKHRDQDQIALHFRYDVALKAHLKRLQGVRWSRTHGCFYMPDSATQLTALRKHCQGSIWLDMTALSGRQLRSAEKNKDNPRETEQLPLSDEVCQKVREMKHWMQQQRYSSATVKTYISFMRSFFSHHRQLPWNGITRDVINAYNHRHFIEGKRSFSAQNQWINAVKLYIRVHELALVDLSEIVRPRKGHTLPDIKHRTLLMLIYSCGLRIGEALSLTIYDIQSEEALIYVRSGKGKKDRRVPLSPLMLEQLRMYYRSYLPKKYLFEGQLGGRYSPNSASNILKRAVKKVGISKRVTLHTLRHSYATHVTQKGVGLRYVQEILGHKSPKTTMIYTHLSGKDIGSVRSPLDDLGL